MEGQEESIRLPKCVPVHFLGYTTNKNKRYANEFRGNTQKQDLSLKTYRAHAAYMKESCYRVYCSCREQISLVSLSGSQVIPFKRSKISPKIIKNSCIVLHSNRTSHHGDILLLKQHVATD